MRPLILVTNDDGITAPGIQALMEVAQELGEVRVVAPDKPQSGAGHSITINSTIRVNHIKLANEEVHAFACTGTPVDCVKMAVNNILPRKPDLILSGINHGSNSSINVIYSGTMSAAIEGALESIPSIGFSLLDTDINADFSGSKKYVKIIAKKVLKESLPEGVCLNVNIPKLQENEIMGMKICRQARANWVEEFEERTDPGGRKYYWLTGRFQNYDPGNDTDIWALTNNYVSVVPTQFDLTAHSALEKMKAWEDDV